MSVKVGDRVRFLNDVPNAWFTVSARKTVEKWDLVQLESAPESILSGAWFFADMIAEVA